MRQPAANTVAAEREAQILAAHGLAADAFASVRAIAEGTRRDASIEVRDPEVRAIESNGNTVSGADTETVTIEVAFSLPGGAYATAVMREIQKLTIIPVDADPEAA